MEQPAPLVQKVLKVRVVTLAIMVLEVPVEQPAPLVQKVLKVPAVIQVTMVLEVQEAQQAQKEIMVLRVMPVNAEEAAEAAVEDSPASAATPAPADL